MAYWERPWNKAKQFGSPEGRHAREQFFHVNHAIAYNSMVQSSACWGPIMPESEVRRVIADPVFTRLCRDHNLRLHTEVYILGRPANTGQGASPQSRMDYALLVRTEGRHDVVGAVVETWSQAIDVDKMCQCAAYLLALPASIHEKPLCLIGLSHVSFRVGFFPRPERAAFLISEEIPTVGESQGPLLLRNVLSLTTLDVLNKALTWAIQGDILEGASLPDGALETSRAYHSVDRIYLSTDDLVSLDLLCCFPQCYQGMLRRSCGACQCCRWPYLCWLTSVVATDRIPKMHTRPAGAAACQGEGGEGQGS